MLRRLTLGLALLLPATLSAQEGSIVYNYSVKYDFEVPEAWAVLKDMIPKAAGGSMLLLFNDSESLMAPAPVEEVEAAEPIGDRPGLNARAAGALTRLKMVSTSRSDQEEILGAYVQYTEGSIVETVEFLGRKFRIADKRPAYEWRLTGEQAEFLGYAVQKATAVQDSSTIEAWFAPEIPVQAGPGKFGGLPGMILVVSVDDGHMQYEATEVNLDAIADGAITAPSEGDEVSRDEYEEIVAEKLEELRTTRRRGRVGR